jgi:hypothetical protein
MTLASEVKVLVEHALADFNSASLTESTRSAFRIATLLGHLEESWIFNQELSPVGGNRSLNRVDIERLVSFRSGYSEEFHNKMLEIWIPERTPKLTKGESDRLGITEVGAITGTIESLERDNIFYSEREAAVARVDKLKYRIRINWNEQILERISLRTYTYLCRVEAELFISEENFNIFIERQNRTDNHLHKIAPAILEEFRATYRRAEEGDVSARSHALHSCRKIIESLADLVCEPSATPYVGKNGKSHSIEQNNYVNRILKYLEENLESKTFSDSLLATMDDVSKRILNLVELAHKGVHDQVSMNEMEWCVIQTYLLVGEILEVFVS